MPDLLTAMRTHLVGQNLARVPRTAGTAHPLWLEPRDGAPAPGEGTDTVEIDQVAVMSAFLTGGIAPAPGEGYSRKDTVDVWLRTATAPTTSTLEAVLRAEFAPAPLGARYEWTMGGLEVIQSSMWRPLQKLGSDENGFTATVSFLFETYVS